MNFANSSGAGEIHVLGSSYKWVIYNFCIGCKKVGERLDSPVFNIISAGKKSEWRLGLYPKGNKENTKRFLAICIEPLNDFEVTATIAFSLLNSKNERVKMASFKNKVFSNLQKWGYAEWIEREYILDHRNSVLVDDTLMIVCDITLDENIFDLNRRSKKRKSEDDIYHASLKEFDAYEKLFENSNNYDVYFKIEGQKLGAHKLILAARSQVFSSLFSSIDNDYQDISNIEITDIRFEAFKELLRFTYAGKVNRIDELAHELLLAANRYRLDGLKAISEDALCNNLKSETVLNDLMLANMVNANRLKARAVEFISLQPEAIVNTPEFEEFAETDSRTAKDVVCAIFKKSKK